MYISLAGLLGLMVRAGSLRCYHGVMFLRWQSTCKKFRCFFLPAGELLIEKNGFFALPFALCPSLFFSKQGRQIKVAKGKEIEREYIANSSRNEIPGLFFEKFRRSAALLLCCHFPPQPSNARFKKKGTEPPKSPRAKSQEQPLF